VAKSPDPPDDKGADPAAGRTSTLLAVLGVLVLVLVLQCGWFVWNAVRDVEVSGTSSSSSSSGDDDADGAPIEVPEGKPVVLNQLAVQEGVDAAASAAEVMIGRNWKSYDEGVDEAVALMTEQFGEEFRTTTDDVRQKFLKEKTEVQVRVVAQGVVRANDTQLEALIFLNQYVFKGRGQDATSTYTPYRALLTMVHTDQGWLVDGIDTK
jgi:Mce-associated membrane protein